MASSWQNTMEQWQSRLANWRHAFARWRDGWLYYVPAAVLPVILLAMVLVIAGWSAVQLFPTGGNNPTEVKSTKTPVFGLTDEERAVLRQLAVANSPVLPPAPPAQSAPSPQDGRLFHLPSDNPTRQADFDAALLRLRGIDPTLANANGQTAVGMLRPEQPGCAPINLLKTVRTLLAGPNGQVADPRDGTINYHLGLVTLCTRSGDPELHFGEAYKAFANASERRDLFDVDRRRLAQYQAASLYGLALARAGWPANTDLDMPRPAGLAVDAFDNDKACRMADADALLVKARTAAMRVAAIERFGSYPFVDFGSQVADADLLNFSTADVLAARVWTALRAGAGGVCKREKGKQLDPPDLDRSATDLTNWLKLALRDKRTLQSSSLAANGAVLALVAYNPGVEADGDKAAVEAFDGDISGVVTLHQMYMSENNNHTLPPAQANEWERLRAMAAIAGASFSDDKGASNNDTSGLQQKCAAGLMPRFKLDEADTQALDRFGCLRAMKFAMASGDPRAFANAFDSLAADPANLDNGFGAAVQSVASLYQPQLIVAEDYYRVRGDNGAVQELDAILAKSELFGSSAYAARMRQLFGSNWLWWVAAIAVAFATLVALMLRRHALHAVTRDLENGWHHRDRLQSSAPRAVN